MTESEHAPVFVNCRNIAITLVDPRPAKIPALDFFPLPGDLSLGSTLPVISAGAAVHRCDNGASKRIFSSQTDSDHHPRHTSQNGATISPTCDRPRRARPTRVVAEDGPPPSLVDL
jgi:hypothetical protein